MQQGQSALVVVPDPVLIYNRKTNAGLHTPKPTQILFAMEFNLPGIHA